MKLHINLISGWNKTSLNSDIKTAFSYIIRRIIIISLYRKNLGYEVATKQVVCCEVNMWYSGGAEQTRRWGRHSNRTNATCHKCLKFPPQDPKTLILP